MDATCWVSWGESIETPYSTDSSWRPLSMHCLHSFTFVTFFILWSLSPAASRVSWYRFCFVCCGLAYEIYCGGGPSMYVYWVLCYHVIRAPYVRSVGHVFAYHYTLADDLECPIIYETSLLPKFVSLNGIHIIGTTFLSIYSSKCDPTKIHQINTKYKVCNKNNYKHVSNPFVKNTFILFLSTCQISLCKTTHVFSTDWVYTSVFLLNSYMEKTRTNCHICC